MTVHLPAAAVLRHRLCAAVLALALPLAAGAQGAAPAPKVLRYAFPVAETGFDPAQISDLYSRVITANILEAPLTYDYLSRPARVKPQTAAALPEVSDDFRTFTFRIRPGIHFADDPAFGGSKRELTAQDYVYSVKRHYDPRYNSASLFLLENAGVLGLSELRKKAMAERAPFPYDTEVEGLRALDRYTFQVRLARSSPRFHYVFADGGITGAVAREVVEAAPGRTMERPVGTGPFRLAQWKRSSRIVLERNPNYREHHYDEQPPADDPRSQEIARRLKGRRLPMIDRVEVYVVEEAQPRWLGFLNEEHDLLERLPADFTTLAIPNNELAPHLARRGIGMDRAPQVDVTKSYFNMEDPVVGGYAPEKVALRRAIGLAYDVNAEILLVRKSQAIPAQGLIAPMLSGYDPDFRSEMSEFNRAKAKALLELYGWRDRDGDGWREQPDGSPLVLRYATQSDQSSRQLSELWKKAMDAVGIRIEFQVAQWPENLKASRAGRLMMWGVAWGAATPDGSYFLDLAYGPNKGQANHARFELPAFDRLYERQAVMPDGPERDAVMREAQKIAVAYMPYKATGHRLATDLMHPWVVGYRRHPFMGDFWRYIDIDPTLKEKRP
ncbi:ABC transporter substrate-binding protein [Caldimonas tepidiphila]|uniref:ABC transporter substrate-binding protein n=1 Tax=Caldimonas tepidiphila TaxID=2315841 RepID=UPI000E5BAE3B|nr:ABC transporter substrate-binding protein [Caldimonas tepidiphila]